MLKVTSQYRNNIRQEGSPVSQEIELGLTKRTHFLPLNAKMIAWGIFLIFFIENGTLGLFPKSAYFIYRNVRISDLLIYGLIIYSFFCSKEYVSLLRSRALILVKIILLYFLFQFVISVIAYKVDVIEYFFRLKQLWMSLLLFPFLLLLKRGGLEYLVKLIFPVAIVSNMIYIISALTGVVLMPETSVVSQDLPGGLKVWRVYGGTFFGEFFMFGIIFYYNEYKFKIKYLPLLILFMLPHILAFGRGAWIFMAFSFIFITIWASIRKHNLKNLIRQLIMIAVTVAAFFYFFNQFIPESDEYTEAIEARIQQGKEDVKYGEGTYGTRAANQIALLQLWAANPIIGIGMHPFWLIKPLTAQEHIYVWGFSDVKWAGVLAAYGAIGFLLAIAFQISFFYLGFKLLLRKFIKANINYFFLLIFLLTMMRDTILGYEFTLFSVGLYAFGYFNAFYIANLVYLYENNEMSSKDRAVTTKKIPARIKRFVQGR